MKQEEKCIYVSKQAGIADCGRRHTGTYVAKELLRLGCTVDNRKVPAATGLTQADFCSIEEGIRIEIARVEAE